MENPWYNFLLVDFEEVSVMKRCCCMVKHAVTDEERLTVSEALESARKSNDIFGTLVYFAQLSEPCPARPKENN